MSTPIEQIAHEQYLAQLRRSREIRKWRATCFVVAALGVASHFWRWVLEVML